MVTESRAVSRVCCFVSAFSYDTGYNTGNLVSREWLYVRSLRTYVLWHSHPFQFQFVSPHPRRTCVTIHAKVSILGLLYKHWNDHFFVLSEYYNLLPFFGSSLPSSFPFLAKQTRGIHRRISTYSLRILRTFYILRIVIGLARTYVIYLHYVEWTKVKVKVPQSK